MLVRLGGEARSYCVDVDVDVDAPRIVYASAALGRIGDSERVRSAIATSARAPRSMLMRLSVGGVLMEALHIGECLFVLFFLFRLPQIRRSISSRSVCSGPVALLVTRTYTAEP